MTPAHFISISTIGFIAALAALMVAMLLAGKVNARGLLTDKITREFSVGRLQLLVATLSAAAFYVLKAARSETYHALPAVPPELFAIAGASNLSYLLAKGRHLLRAVLRPGPLA